MNQYERRNQPFTAADAIFTGEAITITFNVVDDDGDVQVITGWTIQFKLGPSQGSAATLTIAATVTDGPNGICTVALTAANLTTAGAGKHFYTLHRTDVGSERILAYGDFAVNARLS